MLILSALPSTRKVKRDWRPLALNSVVLLRGLFGNGIPVSGVLTSPLTALWRHTDSAARKPPGVSVMPLILMDAGPVSSAFLAALGLPGSAGLAGPGFASLGVSANAAQIVRKNDIAIVASFFISSLSF